MYIGGSCTAIVTAVEPAAPIVAAPQLLSFFTRVESGAQLLSADVRVGGLGQSCKVVAMRPQHGGRAHHVTLDGADDKDGRSDKVSL